MEYRLSPPRRIESRKSREMETKERDIGHIQSAGCLGQREVRWSSLRNACIRELLQEEVNAHGKADRHMRLLKSRGKVPPVGSRGWGSLRASGMQETRKTIT